MPGEAGERAGRSVPLHVVGGAPAFRSYEDLDGAQGRGVYFRPHRYAAADLAPLRGVVEVTTDVAIHVCPLRDVSQNGVAFAWPADAAIRKGQMLRLVVRLDEHEAFRGEAKVSAVRHQQQDIVVGAALGSFLLDTDELLHLRSVRSWGPGASTPSADRSWLTSGHETFKALVADLRLLLEQEQERLHQFEQSLPWHVVQGHPSAPRSALIARLHEEFGVDVVRLAADIDAALRRADSAALPSLQSYSVRHLQGFLMQAPWMHRARHKPFGYPGDYEVMNFVYHKDFEGPTLFARALGHAFLQTPPARAVVCRKDLVKRELRAALDRAVGSARPVRFLSIASGPARELQELLADVEDLPAPLEIVLFDQDKGALAHAYRRLQPIAESRFQGRARIVFLNESIKRLLRDDRLFAEFGGFDVVYSCGLFDYLQEHTAVRLARSLSAAAGPGGRVYVANMVEHPGRWFMEQHLDWELIYRTRDELLEIGRRARPDASVRLLEEETGVNPFIEMVWS